METVLVCFAFGDGPFGVGALVDCERYGGLALGRASVGSCWWERGCGSVVSTRSGGVEYWGRELWEESESKLGRDSLDIVVHLVSELARRRVDWVLQIVELGEVEAEALEGGI